MDGRTSWISEKLHNTIRTIAGTKSVWLVGGVIRDYFLSRPVHDVDVVVAEKARQLARQVANSLGGMYYELDDEYDTGRVLLPAGYAEYEIIDFAGLRGESIHADLAARDFTINAMAVNLSDPDTLIDPLGGRQDILDKCIQICCADAIQSDPLRALRAVRQSVQFGFGITAPTSRAVKENLTGLQNVSRERIRDELFQILQLEKAAVALQVLQHLGLWQALMNDPAYPDLQSALTVHQIRCVEQAARLSRILIHGREAERNANVTMGAISLQLGGFKAEFGRYLSDCVSTRTTRELLFLSLLLDSSPGGHKTSTSSSAGDTALSADSMRAQALSLRLSNAEISFLLRIQRGCLLLPAIQPAADQADLQAYRYFKHTGFAGVAAILCFIASFLAAFDGPPALGELTVLLESARELLQRYFMQQELLSPTLPVSGDDVMAELKLNPGPEIGRILELLREGMVAGRVNSKENALKIAFRALENPSVNRIEEIV